MTGVDDTMDWTRSTYCGSSACVEVANDTDCVYVRDSKDPDGPALAFTHDEWAAFLAGVRNDEFDKPAEREDWLAAEVRSGLPRKANGHRFIAECGTWGGYRRHGVLGEPTCEACREHVAAYERRRQAERRGSDRQESDTSEDSRSVRQA